MPECPRDQIDSHAVFDQVAFALAGDVDDQTMKHVLGALMDRIGVPMMQLEPWKHEPAIVDLFAERGVTLLTEHVDEGEQLDEVLARAQASAIETLDATVDVEAGLAELKRTMHGSQQEHLPGGDHDGQ